MLARRSGTRRTGYRTPTPKDAAAALGRLMEGIGAGELTPSEARSLASLVEAALKSIEVNDHERRLTALEEDVRHVH